ncbi:MAG: hypothetical protein AB7Q17_05920 [Phycisphaerae bacterium]
MTVRSAAGSPLLDRVARARVCPASAGRVVGFGAAQRAGALAQALGAIVLLASLAPAAGQTDRCADAPPIGPGVYAGDTTSADNDGNATCGTSASSRDVWFRFDADADRRLRASTCGGAAWDTVVSIHAGCPGTAANQLACSDDACGAQSTAQVRVTPGLSYFIRVSGFSGARGPFQLTVSLLDPPEPGEGPDLVIGDVSTVVQVGRAGSDVAFGVGATTCNAGTEPALWLGNPSAQHPFYAFNLYRLRGGSLEQIGASWVRHAAPPTQTNACGLGCTPASGALGVGCADESSAFVNANAAGLGPRHEVNPFTGAFSFAGSYLATHNGPWNPIEHRLVVADADLDPVLNPGAEFIIEAIAFCGDESDRANGAAWERVVVSGAPGGTWAVAANTSPTARGTALDAWTGATQALVACEPSVDGRCVVGARVTARRAGWWRYEYAVRNVDVQRAIGSIRVPMRDDVAIANMGFHAPQHDADDVNVNTPWTATRDAAGLILATTPFEIGVPANPVRWGLTYTLGFDANAPPHNADVALALHAPGPAATLAAALPAPRAPATPADLNCDGATNNFDIDPFVLALADPAAYAAAYPACNVLNADINADGLVNNFDIEPFVACVANLGCP